MTRLQHIILGILLILTAGVAHAESSYDIAEFYSVVEPRGTLKAVGKNDRTVEVKYLLEPTRPEKGKFVVEVKKIGDNLYQVIGTDLCVETRYCYKSAYFKEKVVLIIESAYGYRKGRLIFDYNS